MRVFIFLLIGMLSTGCVLAQPASSKYTVRVVDAETLLPITNAMVRTSFEHQYDPWGNKPSIIDRRKEHVNQDGEIVFTGKSLQGGAGGHAFAEGYYSGHNGRATDKNIALNRWEPWNPVVEVKLRPKKNPLSMTHKKLIRIKPPRTDSPVSFDLEKADWVAPYGKGITSDLIFNVSLSESPKKGAKYTLNFSNEADGIQKYLPPEEYSSSAFIWPYVAPLDGYDSNISRFAYYKFPNPDLPSTDLKKTINYIFRVRSHENKNGRIVGSFGMIKGELKIEKENALYFEYWFNPVPNERSLEYNGVNLLKKKK